MLELTQIYLKDTRFELHQCQQHVPGEFPSAIFCLPLDHQEVQTFDSSTIILPDTLSNPGSSWLQRDLLSRSDFLHDREERIIPFTVVGGNWELFKKMSCFWKICTFAKPDKLGRWLEKFPFGWIFYDWIVVRTFQRSWYLEEMKLWWFDKKTRSMTEEELVVVLVGWSTIWERQTSDWICKSEEDRWPFTSRSTLKSPHKTSLEMFCGLRWDMLLWSFDDTMGPDEWGGRRLLYK